MEEDCVIFVDKPLGWTPLQCVQHVNERHGKRKLSYAGRLDPMATGLLILLSGAENKKQPQYLSLKKTYEFQVLFGASSDSYDTLGLLLDSPGVGATDVDVSQLCESLKGPQVHKYPPYSSRPFRGQPLWWWAREGRLDEVDPWPTATVDFSQLFIAGDAQYLTAADLKVLVMERLLQVRNADQFRIPQVLQRWSEVADDRRFAIVSMRAECSTGGYIRGISQRLGDLCGIPALAFSIRRISCGPHTLAGSVNYRFEEK